MFQAMTQAARSIREQAGRAIAPAIELVLIVLIAGLLARLVWLIAFGASATDFPINAASRQGPAAASQAYLPDLDRLRDARLFADRRPERAEVASSETLPETQLNLALHGIRLGATAQSGGAIIQTPDNRQGFFAAGDSIIDGVTLAEVDIDHVIINRRGIREALYLREAANATRAAASSAPAISPSPSRRGGDGFELAGAFRVEPSMNGNQLNGYRLAGGNAVLISTLGLSVGDIIVSVDGRTLSTVDDLNDFFEDLQGRDRLAFSILRGGRPMTLQVDLP
tara:strand:+ start:94 stop:939 length:846 start_codon:yes stop_codon:yes gene_type:complete